MKIVVPQTMLAAVANQMKLAINETSIQALTNIKIDADESGVTLHSTDCVLSLSAWVPEAQVAEPGSICIPGMAFIRLVNALTPGVVAIQLVGSKLGIQTANSSFGLSTLPPEQFPILPDPKSSFIEAPVSAIQEMFQSVLYCASKDENRPMLCGVGFSPQRLMATDGHRLAMKTNHGFQIKREIIIPAYELNQVLKSFPTQGKMAISYGEREAYFKHENRMASIRLLEGPYPEVEKAVPVSSRHEAKMDRAALVSALKRAVLLTGTSKAVRMIFSQNAVKIQASSDLGEANESVATEFPLEHLEIGMSAEYLLHMLEHVKGQMVTFELRDEKTALVIREGDYCHVVMPRRPGN